MKTSLNIRQAAMQTLTMTPQLQQAIRLLQLSTAELQTEIQENLDKNPLLEIDESNTNNNVESLDAIVEREMNAERADDDFNPFNNDRTISLDDAPYGRDNNSDLSKVINEKGESSVSPNQNTNNDDYIENSNSSIVDSDTSDAWRENYSASMSSGRGSFDGDEEMYQGETAYELKDHLLWQLNLTPFTPSDKLIAEAIIDGIDDSGYLTESLDDILIAVKYEFPDTELDEVEAVLKLIQHFDPIGIAGRNVKESLLIQLDQFDKEAPINKLARNIVENYLDLLGNKDYRSLIKKLAIKENELKDAISVITSLEPRPGNFIKHENNEFIIPDVAVVKKNGVWCAELNPSVVPKLHINETYSALCQDSKSSDAQYIKSHMQEASWFIQSLNKRNDTLLKVANCIVKQQQDFFEKGPQAMKPMVLNDVATSVEMHESTVSRVTTEKYMHTPRGTFELKYFFSSHVNTDNGGECSSTAIRALIKELISKENTAKPLSDNQISDVLKEKGIMVARRTVAKYRESLNIPSSSQRKNLI